MITTPLVEPTFTCEGCNQELPTSLFRGLPYCVTCAVCDWCPNPAVGMMDHRLLCSVHFRPLAAKPYLVCRETWVKDCGGGVEPEYGDGTRFSTAEEAIGFAKGQHGRNKIFEMRQGVQPGSEFGTHFASYWDGERMR